MFCIMLPILLLVGLLLLLSVSSLPDLEADSVLIYAVTTRPCSPEYLNFRESLGTPRGDLSNIGCVKSCTNDRMCGLSVIQEYHNGSKICTKLTSSATDVQTSSNIKENSSLTCVMFLFNPCQNGGIQRYGVCSCKPMFTGNICQYPNPYYCNSIWNKILTSHGDSTFTVGEPSILGVMSMHKSKIRFRDTDLGVHSVARHGRASFRDSKYEQHTQTIMDKAAWNRLASGAVRIFKYFASNGDTDTLTVALQKSSFFSTKGVRAHEFLAVCDSPYQVNMTGEANTWTAVKDNLVAGNELFGNTWAVLHEQPDVIISQLTFMRQALAGGYTRFHDRPEWWNVKTVLGGNVHNLLTDMAGASNRQYSTSPTGISTSNSFNPCWMPVHTSGQGTATSQLKGYLRLGKEVRIRAGNTFHNILEVIDTDEVSVFVAAPYMSSTGSGALDAGSTYGVKTLVTTSGTVMSCRHVMEGEEVIGHDTVTGINVTWFVDARSWDSVFAVYSNSSVAHGSLPELAAGVLAGKDVRLWFLWLRDDKSRFLDTHMNSVTDNDQVSSESVLTWRVSESSSGEISLSPLCDYQYVLVTSDGHVEVLNFNIWTPGEPQVETEVLITWFLN